MIRRHMDFRTLHSKIKSGAISSTKELLRDILIFVNNVIAFYPKAMDLCLVDDEAVVPQAGTFYGGWITSAVAGPFKGPPGTERW